MSYKEVVGWFSDIDAECYQYLAGSIHNGIIVEIGTFAGRSAISIGNVCKKNGNVLYCVDHWNGSPEMQMNKTPIMDGVLRQAGHPHVYEHFCERIKHEKLEGVLIPMRMSSEEAATKIAIVDMVFIDATHLFDEVVKDIQLWLPHIKPGGIICGHDHEDTWPEVEKAVKHCLGEVEVKKGSMGFWYKRV